MVIIRVDFLRGAYVAAEPTAAQTCEWPPAPARVFAALVAGAYAIGADPSPLVTLESAPEVRYGDEARAAAGGVNYVPAAFFKGGTRPRRETYRPQMIGIIRPVFYAWEADLDPAWLRPVLAAVTYLGRAESSVRLSLAESMPPMPEHLTPDPAGEMLLRVPGRHWLSQLQAHFGSGSTEFCVGCLGGCEAAEPSPTGTPHPLPRPRGRGGPRRRTGSGARRSKALPGPSPGA